MSCNINLLPYEIMITIFKKLKGTEASICRGVCRQWRDIIDSFSDRDWQHFCREFRSPHVAKAQSSLTYQQLYRSLSLWDRVEEAEVERTELPIEPLLRVVTFKILNYNVLAIVTIEKAEYEFSFLDENIPLYNWGKNIEYYNATTTELIHSENYSYIFAEYDENDKLITLMDVMERLHITIKSSKITKIIQLLTHENNWVRNGDNHIDDESDDNESDDSDDDISTNDESYVGPTFLVSYVLSSSTVYFLNANRIACIARVKATDEEEKIEIEEVTAMRQRIITMQLSVDNVVNILTFTDLRYRGANIYFWQDTVLNLRGQIQFSSRNILHELKACGINWTHPFFVSWLKLSDLLGLVYDVSTAHIHSHVVVMGACTLLDRSGFERELENPYPPYLVICVVGLSLDWPDRDMPRQNVILRKYKSETKRETPTLSSKLCTDPKNAYLCELLDYTNTTRICSMKPTQSIEISDWVSCAGGLPLGSSDPSPVTELDLGVLFECEMEPHESSSFQDIVTLESVGQPVAWKAGSHLAIVLRTNMENLSSVGFNFVGGEFIIDHKLPVVRIQTVQLSGEPNKATDPSMRGLRSDIQHALKLSPAEFQWPLHAALLRKLSKVVDIKSEVKNTTQEMNGNSNMHLEFPPRRNVTLADVSVNTTKSLENEKSVDADAAIESMQKSPEKLPEKFLFDPSDDKKLVVENVTVEIQHNIIPKKSSLKLDLKKGTSQLSTSLLNISSQIKSVTTHKRIVSTTGPKKSHPPIESAPQVKEECHGECSSLHGTPKSTKGSRPLVNTKSPNVLIYSDSVAAKDNLESSLRKVLDCDRYTIYSVSKESLEGGAWRGRAALVAVAGCVGRCAPLLLAHLLDGGRLLALCSDLLHTVLPYYKTAEVRENEIVQFSYDKWKSVKMKHHIFCYQASPAKKQFSTESDRQPSKYTGHPGHELDIQVLASEETWRTPSLLQATDLTNNGIAIFSQIHLEADPCDYLGEEGMKSNEARLEIIHKILGEILGLHVKDPREISNIDYTRGYFLGNHVHKLSLIKGWCAGGSRTQRVGDVTLQWCLRGEEPLEKPSANFLPVYVYECPENFSTVEYYDNLTSETMGRVLVYADTLRSTMDITSANLAHGVGAVARRQTAGRGRGGNGWLSPPGQACITLQVWQKMSPTLPLIQHASALAVVRAIRSQPAYEHVDIRIKWPNDIYYGREVKIGGTIANANCNGDDVIINIGTGVNISNSVPTTCINDVIREHNRAHKSGLAPMSVERFLARYCSQLERILQYVGSDGGIDAFREQYYQYWLHDGEEIRVASKTSAEPVRGTIQGVDDSGWLLVKTARGEIRVEPDGNTFDMMAGLLTPKVP